MSNKSIKEQKNNSGRIFISPLARRIAFQEKKLDISQIKGSGPNGRIVKKDVLKIVKLKRNRLKISNWSKTLQCERLLQIVWSNQN